MYQNKKILGIIPARGGSKRVVGKNMRCLGGIPLVGWAINAAQKSEYIDEIIVSSDCSVVLDYVESRGILQMTRKPNTATDEATAESVIQEVLDEMTDFDYFVYLQPTSPFRTALHIDESLMYCIGGLHQTCVSIVRSHILPYWFYKLDSDKIVPYVDKTSFVRQQLPVPYITNGAIYISSIKQFMQSNKLIDDNTVGYQMSEESSIDIDSEFDFKIARLLIDG